MRKIRIHVGYKTTEAPWGGANNFIRTLQRELEATGRYVFTDSMETECDLLFMNQLTVGPGSQISFDRVRRVREGRRTLADRLRGRRAPSAGRLVVRAVNLNRHAFQMGLRNALLGRRQDREVLDLVNFADFVIFQSRYQREFFTEAGYTGTKNAVVHNGADRAFWAATVSSRPLGPVLRIASSTASARWTKRHDLIAKLSMLPAVEVLHFGNWPTGVRAGRVRRLGMATHEAMAETYATCDYFFHPAVKDPCPNAVFEAVCSGLPVIYNSGPGSSAEVVGENGFAFDETSFDEEIVRRARAALPELKEAVARNRAYYAVERAASQYREIFDAEAAQIIGQ
jgi:glycosyltransferase involved in cell wall biosynthesis